MKKIEIGIVVFLGITLLVAAGFAGYTIRNGTFGPEILAATLVVIWFALLGSYFVWALYRYNVNYGLTDHEWAVLYPELYASAEELPRYRLLHKELMESRALAAAQSGVTVPPFAPETNPYGRDSFGLPPGTIRGAMALTALVLFSSMEIVNVFVKRFDGVATGWETQFHELITAFMMVLAFYFGSRAVEALKDRDATRPKGAPRPEKEEAAAEKPSTAAAKAAAGAGAGAPAGAPDEEAASPPAEVDAPSRQPALPAHLQADRVSSLVTLASLSAAPATSGALTPNDPLGKRVLALTAAFETGAGFPACFSAVAPSFDGMGLSFGALQWNLGTGTLQPLWQRMRAEHEDVCKQALGRRFAGFCELLALPTREAQVAWAEEIQKAGTRNGKSVRVLDPEWQKALAALGQAPQMIELQVEAAATRYRVALGWCREWDLLTERAVALMFDVNVQNGKLDRGNVRYRIERDLEQLPRDLPPLNAELEKLSIIATRRSEIVDPRWRQDVLSRKLTIARGDGVVHGRRFDLLREFCIGLVPADAPAPRPDAVAGAAVGAGAAPAGFPREFPLEAMIASDTALRMHLDNTPAPEAERNLRRLCNEFLVPVAARFPGLRVTSGFRSPAVNKAVGGSPTSAHQFGRAVDFVPPAGQPMEEVVAWLSKDSRLPFDQVILEFGRWVHLGIADEGAQPRGQVLTTIAPGQYEPFQAKAAPVEV